MTDNFDWTEGELIFKDGDFVPPAKLILPLVYVAIDDTAGICGGLYPEHQQSLQEEARRAEALRNVAEKQGDVHGVDIIEPDGSPEQQALIDSFERRISHDIQPREAS